MTIKHPSEKEFSRTSWSRTLFITSECQLPISTAKWSSNFQYQDLSTWAFLDFESSMSTVTLLSLYRFNVYFGPTIYNNNLMVNFLPSNFTSTLSTAIPIWCQTPDNPLACYMLQQYGQTLALVVRLVPVEPARHLRGGAPMSLLYLRVWKARVLHADLIHFWNYMTFGRGYTYTSVYAGRSIPVTCHYANGLATDSIMCLILRWLLSYLNAWSNLYRLLDWVNLYTRHPLRCTS